MRISYLSKWALKATYGEGDEPDTGEVLSILFQIETTAFHLDTRHASMSQLQEVRDAALVISNSDKPACECNSNENKEI